MDTHSFENKRWSGPRQSAEFRHAAAVALAEGDTMLDVGCGDGLLMRLLRAAGVQRVSGADLSEVAAEHCEKEGFKVMVGDFSSDPIPAKDAEYDCVLSLDTLEHLYDPLPLMREIARVSKGVVVIGVPNFSSVPARLQCLFGNVPENNRPAKGHVYWFNWRILTRLVEESGMKIVASRVNAPWGRFPIIGRLTHALARAWPNAWALSFVVRCAKVS
jgi:SAM-dependent methyltransferase